ncbi:hypothetical protein VNO77_03692 [Canavalia gladiata]|uniref:Uncharacterized protein n=1 Tax=Canavalia gladiata TaxID=3824 RepID=A0AAN9MW01_CANGL
MLSDSIKHHIMRKFKNITIIAQIKRLRIEANDNSRTSRSTITLHSGSRRVSVRTILQKILFLEVKNLKPKDVHLKPRPLLDERGADIATLGNRFGLINLQTQEVSYYLWLEARGSHGGPVRLYRMSHAVGVSVILGFKFTIKFLSSRFRSVEIITIKIL